MPTTMNQTMATDMVYQCEYCNHPIWHNDDKKWYPDDLSDSEYEKTIKEYGSDEGFTIVGAGMIAGDLVIR